MIDIDSTWDPSKGSLDEHRMKMLETLQQPGFGADARSITPDDVAPVIDVQPDKDDEDGE